MFEHTRQSCAISEAVDNIASNHVSTVSGELRLSAPPSISRMLLAPLVGAFQIAYRRLGYKCSTPAESSIKSPRVSMWAFKADPQLKDSSLVARKILTYRHQLVASAAYLAGCKAPGEPQDLLQHRLLAFSFWKPANTWNVVSGKRKETLTFHPNLSMNDYAGLVSACSRARA